MTTTRLFVAISTALTLALTLSLVSVHARAEQARKPASVYTKEQAASGLTAYDASCAGCHELGKFKGTEFSNAWSGKPLTDLHAAVMSMPMDAPGSLSKQEYADILAYFLSLNGPRRSDPAGRHGRGDRKRITLDVKK